jgi:sterol desaturase/sphingolipid hydroxylase (fatty acid hydroxylase superfamily)
MLSPLQSRRRLRLFGNPALEALTVISAPAFLCLWAMVLPAIFALGIIYSPTAWAPLMVASGMIVWTLVEYLLHRFVFHFDARSDWMRKVIFVIHDNHHVEPNDPLRNLMPPIVSLPVGALVWAACIGLVGISGTWYFLGFMIGYVAYDLVHYACHQWPMKGRLGRMLKVHHMRHHHLRAAGNFAITGAAWDRVFSTRILSARERT